jgi:glycosyltransferase involved in cell wall biosynthesis
MRVLLSSHGASLFGAERVLMALARGLAARGHDITLEVPHDGPGLRAALHSPGVQVIVSRRCRLPRNRRELLSYAAEFRRSVQRVRSLTRQARYDVVWVNSIYNVPAAFAARGSGAAVVWHLHERNFARPAANLAARCVQACSQLAVAPSRFVSDSFVSAGLAAAGVRIVSNAVLEPLSAAPPRPHRADLVIGYVGQLEPRKRVGDIIEAVGRLPGVTALIAGDGKARADVTAAAHQPQVQNRIRLTGFLDDIFPLLSDCDCVVIPSGNEAFGLVAVEAMAVGRPVIAAESGALPEVLGDAALYYPLGDVDGLTACLRRLQSEPGLAAELRERGLARVPQFTVERMLDGVEAVLQDAVALQGGASTDLTYARAVPVVRGSRVVPSARLP